MDKRKLVLDNGTTLKYKHCPATIIFQVFDQLRDSEYTSYNFCYYARIDGKVYRFDGYWADPGTFNYSREFA